ncbi:MAG: hypothetical protein U5J83_05880 [Bryobacterales bacterium]|nr:hypothetical protein [Bryobacterales bacterium]
MSFPCFPLALLLLVFAGALCPAQDRLTEKYEKEWREFRLPPFEVLSERDNDDTRAFLGDLFQFRHLLATAFPGKELKAQWPIRIWLLDDRGIPTEAPDAEIPVVVDRYTVAMGRPPRLSPALRYRIAQTIMRDNLRPMPGWFERGLLSLLGGARIEGQVIQLGGPVSPEGRDLDWARVYTLLASKESVPVLSAMTGNLEKGMDVRLALRNSYQTDIAKIDSQARTVLEFSTVKPVLFSGLANNPKKDFRDWYVPLGYDQLARLSLLAARNDLAALGNALAAVRPRYEEFDARARVEIQALDALHAIRSGEAEEGARLLKSLTAIGITESPRVYLEAAKLSSDSAEKKRLAALAKERNAEWAEVDRVLASIEKEPAARAKLLSAAANHDPRNRELWKEAAKAAVEAREFAMADSALEGAERSTGDEAEKQLIRDERWRLKDLRAKKDEEVRQLRLAEERKEIEALKSKTMARIDEALARANKQNESPGVEQLEVVKYGELDEKESVTGRMIRIECRSGGALVLELESETERTRLLLPDASKVTIEGGGALEFRCGAQSPARLLTAQYMPKTNAVLGTIGEVQLLRPEAEPVEQPEPQ